MNKSAIRFAKTKFITKDAENIIIDNMGHTLEWIFVGVLEGKTDQFEKRLKKMENCWKFIKEEKAKSHLDTTDGTANVLVEAETKRKHVYDICREVPFSQLLYIAKPIKNTADPNLRIYLQSGYIIIGVWVDRVLQEHYRFSIAERTQFLKHMNNWIDSYQKGYLSNKGINEMFIEDINYDMEKGEKV